MGSDKEPTIYFNFICRDYPSSKWLGHTALRVCSINPDTETLYWPKIYKILHHVDDSLLLPRTLIFLSSINLYSIPQWAWLKTVRHSNEALHKTGIFSESFWSTSEVPFFAWIYLSLNIYETRLVKTIFKIGGGIFFYSSKLFQRLLLQFLSM